MQHYAQLAQAGRRANLKIHLCAVIIIVVILIIIVVILIIIVVILAPAGAARKGPCVRARAFLLCPPPQPASLKKEFPEPCQGGGIQTIFRVWKAKGRFKRYEPGSWSEPQLSPTARG